MSSVKIILRKNAKLKNGKYPLKIRIYKSDNFKEISIPGCSTEIKNWDHKNQIVLNNPQMTSKIQAEKHKYVNAINKLEVIDEEYDFDRILEVAGTKKRKRKNNTTSKIKIIPFIEDNILTDPNLRYGTKKNYKSLNQLLEKLKYNPNISEIDCEKVKELIKKIEHKFEYMTWTIHCRIKCLKSAMNKAYRMGLIDKPDWSSLNLKRGKTEVKFLSTEEIKMLHNFDPEPKKDKKIKDAFIFSCYTGIRCGDIQVLTYKNLSVEYVKNEKIYQLQYKMRKNKKEVTLYLPKAIEYIIKPKLIGTNHFIFGLIRKDLKSFTEEELDKKVESNNAYISKRLKIIQNKAGLKNYYSFHKARKSFFCHGIKEGIHNFILKEIGGLSSTDVLENHYSKAVNESKYEAAKIFDKI